MFIIERMTSLAVYAVALLAACLLIGGVTGKQYKVILAAYLGVLAVFAFQFKPYVTTDLYRLREYIEFWIHLDWRGVVKYAMKSSTPFWVLYSYVISKLGNINWLQTITCLWCFGNVFYIIAHEIERQKIEGKYRSELLFYIMAVGSFYLQAISGIRSMLGISIVAFCLYRETVEQKRIVVHLPLWLFAALIHTSTTVLVASRFLLLLIQRRDDVKRFFSGMGPAKKIVLLMVVLVLAIFELKGGYIKSSIVYGWGYISNSDEYHYFWEIVIGLLEACETFYVMIEYRKMSRNSNMEPIGYGYRTMYLFTLFWSVVSVIALPFSYSIFRRYTILCTVTSIPLAAVLFRMDVSSAENNKKRFRVLFVFSMLIFALSGVRGDLCGYKFFVLN